MTVELPLSATVTIVFTDTCDHADCLLDNVRFLRYAQGVFSQIRYKY